MQDNATDYVTRVRYLAIRCINLHRYFTVLHFLEVKISELRAAALSNFDIEKASQKSASTSAEHYLQERRLVRR